MAYSRIKTWIPGEILTASDLNSEFNGNITNENDLDTRLVNEVTARNTLQSDHNTLANNVWNVDHIADNKVTAASMADLAVETASLANLAVTDAKVAAANKDGAAGTVSMRTLGTGATAACAGNDARLSDQRTPIDGSVTEIKIGAGAVSQSKLKTSIGSVSGTLTRLTLPGGQYGFYPQTKGSTTTGQEVNIVFNYLSGNASLTAYATYISMSGEGTGIGYAQQRYITASGEIHWIFILRDKNTKQIQSMYQAPDHPCFGNGGKPLVTPHPFGSYDETKHEIIVINPSLADIEKMELETIVDDETKPDKCLLQIISENYEINKYDEVWPDIPVTVGLPKHIVDKKTGRKTLADYRFMQGDTIIEPVKKIIPKPEYIKVKSLKRKCDPTQTKTMNI